MQTVHETAENEMAEKKMAEKRDAACAWGVLRAQAASLYLESLSGGKPVRDLYCLGAAVDPLTIRSAWSRTVPMDTPFIRLLRA